jgi:pimeloyl-ACP methyl ester carboxylesterase
MRTLPALSVVVALLLGACQGLAAPAPASQAATSAVSPSEAAAPTGPSALPSGISLAGAFDVGGHSLYIECAGTGSPTIVFLHGIGGDRTHGDGLQQAFSSRVRVCTYDRANMGRSDHVEGLLTGAAAAKDLGALLAAANVPPPYVLVGGSFGGLIALIYAGSHPKDVVGMVFVDASLPSDADVDQLLVDRGFIPPIKPTDPYANNGESFLYSVVEEARAAEAAIPDVPMSYLRSTQFDAPPGAPVKEMQAIGQKGIDALLAHSSHGKLIDVDGPHFPFPDQPVNVEVKRVLDLIAGA